jgi:hypothetical protein
LIQKPASAVITEAGFSFSPDYQVAVKRGPFHKNERAAYKNYALTVSATELESLFSERA